MKSIIVLGSTGTIGTIALKIIKKFPRTISVTGLSAYTNVNKLAKQVNMFNPEIVAVRDEFYAEKLEKLIDNNSTKTKIVFGSNGYNYIASYEKANIVLNAIIGSSGLLPTLAAIDSEKTIALANKESLVMAGKFIIPKIIKNKITLLPIDSEHSAIYQCILNNNKDDLKGILLTASGGPLLNKSIDEISTIKINKALKHPNWPMGEKISIDSATLMNKALEIIEAKWLFNLSANQIKVVIHPESIIHSMIYLRNNTVFGQISIPDMIGPISYALLSNNKFDIGLKSLDFSSIKKLSFSNPNIKKFPCLKLGFEALNLGGVMPTVLNASNEVAVNSFLNGEILISEIYYIVKKCMDSCKIIKANLISDIIKTDFWARKNTKKIIKTIKKQNNYDY